MAGLSAEPATSCGLYIHVPFCLRKCFYCDFYSIPYSPARAVRFLAALTQEISIRAQNPPFARRRFSSLYFGGGTPSLLTTKQLATMLSAVDSAFGFVPGAEISLEANPATLSLAQLRELRAAGISRLSLGVQSLQEAELHTLGRLHTGGQARQMFRAARKAGFDNLNIDLIYAVPGQTIASWEATLREVLVWRPEHISVYALTLEENTPMARAVANGTLTPKSPEMQSSMFLITHELLAAHGYEHYEISNYALPGRRCRHNELYWRRDPYLGLGPSAHSFHDKERWWNHANMDLYCEALSAGTLPVAQKETLSPEQEDLERVMLSLRTVEGLDFRACAPNLVRKRRERAALLADNCQQAILIVHKDRIHLTPHGFLVHEEVCRLLA
ncbi:MAG: radical SAM family heme chaperone HemW [Candidatus Oleimicrobiaceae bacterium]